MDFQNPFMGINPLLHEILLTDTGWKAFHNLFLGECYKAIQARLINTPYIADLEDTLKIQHLGETFQRYYPDLLISTKDFSDLNRSIAPQGMTMTISDVLTFDDSEPEPMMLVISKTGGDPITVIELLSPSNKLPFRDYYQYRSKREMILSAGIAFVEFDFIHNQPPTLRYADYSKSEKRASPFHVTVLIPTPNIEIGVAQAFHFGILDFLPTVSIPLLNSDVVTLDLDAIYQKLFVDAFFALRIQSKQPPLTTYHPDDRQKILDYLNQHEGRK